MKIRNCAFVDGGDAAVKGIVWARDNVVSHRCPKSVITAQSAHLLELFRAWKEFGGGDFLSLEAKSADAICLLEKAWRREDERGES